jgi:urea transporter
MVAAGAPRRAAETWGEMAESNPAVGVVDTLLRGTGQVMFQNNPLTGLVFLAGTFVLTAWLLLFAVLLFANLRPTPLIAPAAPDVRLLPPTDLREALTGAGAVGLTPVNMTNALFRGIGEVMFQDKLATGVIFLFAIFINSRISALFAFLGSALGALTAWTVGASGIAIFHGLYGFNSVLTAIALGGLFYVLTWRSAVYALIAAIITALVFAAISLFLSPIGMPALTAPFVLVTWIFLLAKAGFKALVPVGLADVTTAEAHLEGYRTRGAGPSAPARSDVT